MSNKKDLSFSLKGFQILHFSFYTPDTQVRKDRMTFGIQHRFLEEYDQELFHVGIKVKVVPSKKASKNIAFIETKTTYELKGLKEKGLKSIPKELLVTFFSIAYSNTRGALAAKAQGTIAGDNSLPLVDPVKVVESMKQHVESAKTGDVS